MYFSSTATPGDKAAFVVRVPHHPRIAGDVQLVPPLHPTAKPSDAQSRRQHRGTLLAMQHAFQGVV